MKIIYGASLAALLVSAFTASAATPSTMFYTVAHEDDWQLFMNPNAYYDVRDANTKAVIIHTTAGDAGAGTGTNGRAYPYYAAREEGALRALRFMKSAQGSIGAQVFSSSTVSLNGHEVARYQSKDGRAVMYFFRLPDGNGNGAGYSGTGSQSIEKLKTSGKAIDAIDGSASYASWNDFVATLAQLVRSEASGSVDVWLNLADTDTSINPGDHSDHRYTSLAMQEARPKVSICINQALFSEYDTGNRAANIAGDGLLINAAAWGATTSGIADLDHASTFEGGHNAWLSRNYFRTIDGYGACSF